MPACSRKTGELSYSLVLLLFTANSGLKEPVYICKDSDSSVAGNCRKLEEFESELWDDIRIASTGRLVV